MLRSRQRRFNAMAMTQVRLPALTGIIGSGMKIAKPLLLITTPIGLAVGLYEGWRLAGGLVFIMAALMAVIGVAMGSVVLTIRRERAAENRRLEEAARPDSKPDANQAS
jgi:predicted MFS family arabinose efflux permease